MFLEQFDAEAYRDAEIRGRLRVQEDRLIDADDFAVGSEDRTA